MSIFEAIFKVNIEKIEKITIKKKGSGMTSIIIAFFICCTIVTCCIACFSKFERAHYTINLTIKDQATAVWLLQRLAPVRFVLSYPDESGKMQNVEVSTEKEPKKGE